MVYLANATTIQKLSNDSEYQDLINISSGFNNITKLQTDLLGRVYVLDNNCIKSIENTTVTDYPLSNVKSFAFDFVDDNVYLLYNESEIVYNTTDVGNVSIEDLVIPNDFNLSGDPTNPTIANSNLQFFTAKEGANAYVVKPQNQAFTQGESFKFDKLISYSDEYVKICTVMYNGEPKFYALANQTSIVLIDISQVENTNKQYVEVVKNAFIATNVNCYYLPILTNNAQFALTNASIIRLSKATPISVKKQLEFLGYDYYYAEFMLNGISYCGYIPCDFTANVLTENFEWDEFTLEQVNKTWVYSDSAMQEKMFELKQDSIVRVVEKGKTVCKIIYQNGENWEIGYIYTNEIIDHPAIAIRNILIVLAVVACVCGTCIYFLLRKKRLTTKTKAD